MDNFFSKWSIPTPEFSEAPDFSLSENGPLCHFDFTVEGGGEGINQDTANFIFDEN